MMWNFSFSFFENKDIFLIGGFEILLIFVKTVKLFFSTKHLKMQAFLH